MDINNTQHINVPISYNSFKGSKNPESVGLEFASVFFKQMINHMFNTIDSDQENMWNHFQSEIFAHQISKGEAARPIREAITKNIIQIQEQQGERHV